MGPKNFNDTKEYLEKEKEILSFFEKNNFTLNKYRHSSITGVWDYTFQKDYENSILGFMLGMGHVECKNQSEGVLCWRSPDNITYILTAVNYVIDLDKDSGTKTIWLAEEQVFKNDFVSFKNGINDVIKKAEKNEKDIQDQLLGTKNTWRQEKSKKELSKSEIEDLIDKALDRKDFEEVDRLRKMLPENKQLSEEIQRIKKLMLY